MTTGEHQTDEVREDEVLGEVFPQLTEHLAARYADEYDVEARLARFTAWLGEHADSEIATGNASTRTMPTQLGRDDLDITMPPRTPTEAEALLEILIAREAAARQARMRMGQRVLAAVMGFALVTGTALAFAPHFGASLVAVALTVNVLVAAVAIIAQSPGAGSGHAALIREVAWRATPHQRQARTPKATEGHSSVSVGTGGATGSAVDRPSDPHGAAAIARPEPVAEPLSQGDTLSGSTTPVRAKGAV